MLSKKTNKAQLNKKRVARIPTLEKIAPREYAARIKRPGVVDVWMYEPFKEAVVATGRHRIIMAGLTYV
jgi:hypothetical protein